jgi:hypothetical protein
MRSVGVRPQVVYGLPTMAGSMMKMVIGTQTTPSPVKPALQAQEKEPGVLVQVAFASQLSVPSVHSSSSVQVTPSPE